MNRPEQELQKSIVQYLTWACPPPPEGPEWCHVPNGGVRTKAEAAILKAMGVKPGWPDLQFVWRGRAVCIELKSGDAGLSKAQEDRCMRLILAGAALATCRSLEEVIDFLTTLGVPLRARVAA
jgi:hypothetical protein